ncbi:hypothetical protein [Sulfobacillus harzensis]|uniref:Uncharacterized protein n=1 Tax=Sulfobacillus harzensis TaxID=2729629 RepID=A0A7Y0L3G4_9FIRM|nr:hypothetical protein [Sulfobacillus harzensis]NMP22510.1 hypothetical protein [Sulfobacillus harzensis]
MSGVWLWVVVALSFATDWPWLLIAVFAALAIHWNHWPVSPWWLVLAVAGALAVEALLVAFRPRKRVGTVATDVAMEGAALGNFVLLWGTFPGLALWQGALGFDAASRLHTLVARGGRRVLLRTVRALAAALFLWAYHGLWTI